MAGKQPTMMTQFLTEKKMIHQMDTNDRSDSDSDCDLAFATLDLTGVTFDDEEKQGDTKFAVQLEQKLLHGENLDDASQNDEHGEKRLFLLELYTKLQNGKYVDILLCETSEWLLGNSNSNAECDSVWNQIRTNLSMVDSILECIEAEFFAIAALNLFLQLNYTGPVFDITNELNGINPHPCFARILNASPSDTDTKLNTSTTLRDTKYQNAVLSELTVDGMWPCQVAKAPYFLLLARCILLSLSDPGREAWTHHQTDTKELSSAFRDNCSHLQSAPIWSARAAVAHERLLLSRHPTTTLWDELESTFPRCIKVVEDSSRELQASVLLEYGLACYHFDHTKKGKDLFSKAVATSGLTVEVTGAMGKRTKFQTKTTAQMLVKAVSAPTDQTNQKRYNHDASNEKEVKSQMIEHSEDSILLERVKFDKDTENEIDRLTILDQAIILALCLDVKNNNPMDGLTSEEMSAYLARVLCHHDDWTVYSTALLERAWLEFERNHTKERAILQLQALADQHTNRLTITQSTRKSIEESSPVQDRLKNLHSIVYPPRWHMLRDVAERYATLGIVTSAAEIFAEIEYWDEVVECYRRAGKEKRAEEIVREQLSIVETPRMWVALGDITNDISHYEKAIKLSKGRFCQAFVSLGESLFKTGDLSKASENYQQALKLRPLLPAVWFKLGTISMQLGDWSMALKAFSEVVQQQPDEADAWANVAAVHMHEKRPAGAYPALVESLKHSRNNWRVWVNKLYICIDLKKFDEATQACIVLLDLKAKMSTQGIPDLEERCVKAIVGGIIDQYVQAKNGEDDVSLDSVRRSLSRVHTLLERIRSSSSEAWVFETMAYFHEEIGQDKEVFDNLMKEYRSLISVRAWEKDDHQVRKVCQVVSQIVHYQKDSKEDLVKSKFLLSGLVKRVDKARVDMSYVPEEISSLRALLEEVSKKL